MNKNILENRIQELEETIKAKDQMIAKYNMKIETLKD